MAKKPSDKLRITDQAQKNVLSYMQSVGTVNSIRTEMYSKMEAIDIAYARFQASAGKDCANEGCGDLFAQDDIVAPIVISQVDSLVAYLAEVFLTGSPLFPVVSTPAKRKWAEQLETLMDDHALLGGYPRQLLMFLRDAVKYNVGAVECDWDSVDQFNVIADFTENSGQTVQKTQKNITKIKRLDMYNTIWDANVLPGDVSADGDYAGYIELLSKTKVKRLLNKYSIQQEAYNVTKAMRSTLQPGTSCMYATPPSISNYITSRKPNATVDWDAWFDGTKPRGADIKAGTYEKFTLYARIVPEDYGIIAPQPRTPQIWKFVSLNGVLVHAKRIISAYDRLPILFGQPLEDGLGYQTQSVAETQIPIQEAATTMFNIRFSAARRAVSDRALYDPEMIRSSDVNSASPAPKIPVTINPLSNKGLEQAYRQIPYDMRGTETAFQDIAGLVDFSKQLSGLNAPQQGQFQRGNKSVREWTDTMGGSDGRLRLPALGMEHQVLVWIRFIIVLNIFQSGEDAIVVSQKNGEVLEVKIDELRKQVLSFRTADGYTPKSKLAATDVLMSGMNLLLNAPILQQAYGPMLPAMFAHMMQLGGVRGLEEYAPEVQQQALGTASPLALQAPMAQNPAEEQAEGAASNPAEERGEV